MAADNRSRGETKGAAVRLGLLLHVCAVITTGALAADAVQLPTAPMIAGAQVTDIAASMRVNGTPTSIRSFAVDKPLDEVTAFYRQQFGSHRVENSVMGWQVVARRNGDFLTTVRLRKVTGRLTEGTVAVSDLKQGAAAHDRPRGFASPADSRVVTDMDMDDPGKRGRLVVLRNAHSIETNADFFKRELANKGYRFERDLTSTDAGHEGRSLWFSNLDGQEAVIVIAKVSSTTAVALNFVDNMERKQ